MTDSEDPNRRLTVFLCHSSGDKAAVRKFYSQLLADGFDPWLDEEKILAGQDWHLEITKAVRNVDVVIVCLSPSSITQAGYVQKEIKYALDVADEQPEGTIYLIPLKLEECALPDRLSRWHCVNLFENQGYGKLVAALQYRSRTLGLSLAVPETIAFSNAGQSAVTSSGVQKKICMLGASAVGKTSLVKRFVESIYSDKYHTTVGVKVDKKVVKVDDKQVTMMLWDIEGQDEFQDLRKPYLRGAGGALLVADGTRRQTLTLALELRQTLSTNVGPVPVVLAINKTDLSSAWEIHDSEIETLSAQGLTVVKTSAKTGMGVEEAFLTLARLILDR